MNWHETGKEYLNFDHVYYVDITDSVKPWEVVAYLAIPSSRPTDMPTIVLHTGTKEACREYLERLMHT